MFFSIHPENRDGSRAAATSKMEHFVIIVNGWKPALDTPLLKTS